MTFVPDTIQMGTHNSVVTGAPFTLNGMLDNRLALLRGVKVYVPNGFFGLLWRMLLEAYEDLGPEPAFRLIASYCAKGAQIADSAIKADVMKLDLEKLREFADAAQVSLNDADAIQVWRLLSLAQHSSRMVSQWRAITIFEVPAYDRMVTDLSLETPSTFNHDLELVEKWALMNALLALVTRQPKITNSFASTVAPRDMEQRAATLDRVAALFGTAAMAGRIAKLALCSSLLELQLFDYEASLELTASQLDRLKSRIDATMVLGSDQYRTLFKDALTTSGVHLKRDVTVFRLPQGVWAEYYLGDLKGAPNFGVDQLGISVDVPDITADTRVMPDMYPLANGNALPWKVRNAEVFRRIRREIETLAKPEDADPDINYAIRDAASASGNRVREAVQFLQPAAFHAIDMIGLSDPKEVPVIYDIFQAEESMDSLSDFTRNTLIPATFGKEDARDLARFLRGRKLALKKRLSGAISKAFKYNGNKEPLIIFFAPQSPMQKERPLIDIPVPVWEMMPSAYLGQPENGLFYPMTEDGLAKILDLDIPRMQEVFQGLLHGQDGDVFASALAYAWAQVGQLITVSGGKQSGSARKKAEGVLATLVKEGVGPRSEVGPYAAISDRLLWGVVPDSHREFRFKGLVEMLQLDQDGVWYLAPYTHVPAPCNITNPQLTPLMPPNLVITENERARYGRVYQAEDYLLRCTGLTRVLGRDSREWKPFSFPAARQCGSQVVLTLRGEHAGIAMKYQPLRFDAADLMVWSDENLLQSPASVQISVRPGAGTAKIDEAISLDPALSAEPAMEL